ncbi:hypothetical protein SARC_07797 [Sphaeroforma arctica JP610]|uniref:Spondin-like TSP1 domain-containing protein n=1 Tax=Sphaeroforma arctica JP610 TaxID=667725 RepID=A0A0L0FTD7_9EUKA|nr:hypothetical protein SARC_07797 [Sphaeroforma arctica JP610]KNC79826.1 hypothetical protein SARC_07797 [Sphaeroforma arctica JP610]|eukprot:XP_014153728.1 hypothetical protein SARC_07797 [Sphaeroforma arctica JP610]
MTSEEPVTILICQTPCVVSDWSDYSPCPVICGPASAAVEISTRTIIAQPTGNVTDPAYLCPPPEDLVRTTPCVDVELCPVDCMFGVWTEWGACSQFLGESGQQTRSRSIVQSAVAGGAACMGDIVEQRVCNELVTQVANFTCTDFLKKNVCPKKWAPFPNPGRIQCNGPCVEKTCCQLIPEVPTHCQTGTNHPESGCAQKLVQASPQIPVNFKNVSIPDPFGNVTDPTLLLGCQPQTSYCLGLDGYVTVGMQHIFSSNVVLYFCEPTLATQSTDISAYTKAFDLYIGSDASELFYVNNYLLSNSMLWNTGLENVLYQNIVIPSDGCYKYIKVCDKSPLELQPFPTYHDVVITDTGTETVTDTEDTTDIFDGYTEHSVDNWVAIAMIQSTESCACTINQTVTPWTPWSDCTVNCGGGMQGRLRTPLQQAAYGGSVFAGPFSQERVCLRDECLVNCEVSEWTDYTPCSTTCDDSIQTRNRTVAVEPESGGQPCPELSQTLACNTDPQHQCDYNNVTDCTADPWSDWSVCTSMCGDGVRISTCGITSPGSDPLLCPTLLKTDSRPSCLHLSVVFFAAPIPLCPEFLFVFCMRLIAIVELRIRFA